jgi:8-oxo-dGTP pyrophosphatase MutT (NUDIX family)
VTNDHAESGPSWARVDDGEHDRTIEENWLFRLRKERFRSRASGLTHDFFVVHLADAVHAIAVTPDDQVVFVRQFRAASARDSLEVPGGLVDPGEDPLVAGVRELREETGYAGDPPVLIGTLWSNPSLVTSRTTTIVIRNARKVAEPKLDHTEELAVELVPAGEVMSLIRRGGIDHALVVAGLLWWLAEERPGDPRSGGPDGS